jgi:hypothetical protein
MPTNPKSHPASGKQPLSSSDMDQVHEVLLRESTIQEFLRTPPRSQQQLQQQQQNANQNANGSANQSKSLSERRRLDMSSHPAKFEVEKDIEVEELNTLVSRSKSYRQQAGNARGFNPATAAQAQSSGRQFMNSLSNSNNTNNNLSQLNSAPPSFTRTRKLAPMSENINRFTMLNGPDGHGESKFDFLSSDPVLGRTDCFLICRYFFR